MRAVAVTEQEKRPGQAVCPLSQFSIGQGLMDIPDGQTVTVFFHGFPEGLGQGLFLQFHYCFAFLNSSISFGATSNRSPTIP